MSSGLKSARRVSGAALAFMMAAALAACDAGPAPTMPGSAPMGIAPPPIPDSAATEQMNWTWGNQNLEGWTLSAIPTEVTWPEGGGVSLRAPSEPEYPDVFMRSPPLSFSGRALTRIVVDLETIAPGIQPDLHIYYSTASHGETIDYRGIPDNQTLPQAGERRVLVFDMTQLAAGGTDWVDNAITSFRFDLPQGRNSHHVVHSIRVCGPDDADCG